MNLMPLARAIKIALYSHGPVPCWVPDCKGKPLRNGRWGPVCFDHIEFGGFYV